MRRCKSLGKTSVALGGAIATFSFPEILNGLLALNYVILARASRVELYIDVDQNDGASNKAMFDSLFKEKAAIEKEFGESLKWERLDNSRACRISANFQLGGWKDEANWGAVAGQDD